MATESGDERRPTPRWIPAIVAMVMAVWATGQLIVVQTRGLSSWRAGGFGMYGGFHPVQNDAWVWRDDEPSPIRFWKHSDDDSRLYRIVRPHLTFPRPERLTSDLRQSMPGVERVEILSLNFDVETGVLSRRQILNVQLEPQSE